MLTLTIFMDFLRVLGKYQLVPRIACLCYPLKQQILEILPPLYIYSSAPSPNHHTLLYAQYPLQSLEYLEHLGPTQYFSN